MRADMAKVIVERPRFKGWASKKPKGYRRRLRRYGDDGPPAREGIKTCWKGGTKGFNEHLGPLRRYLDRQVGRPWDKVFSEICAHINRDSVVQDHVRDHVDDYVITNVILINGVPCHGAGRVYGESLDRWPRWHRWYVCPRTGLLRRVRQVRQPRRLRQSDPECPRWVRVSDTLQCRVLSGAWHLLTLRPLPLVRDGRRERDVLLDRPLADLSEETARTQYGAAVYAVAVRRLARRELRHYPIPVDAWI